MPKIESPEAVPDIVVECPGAQVWWGPQ